MKGKFTKGMVSLGLVAACSMMSVMTAAAESGSGYSAANDVWAFRAVADVKSSVNIRAYASEDSAVVGYLTTAACADIIERGETWSLVISGGVQGYVKNEYLAFGDDAEYLANVYGMPGVKTYWDGVYLFEEPSAAADIAATAYNGQEFEVISNDGTWVTVQLSDDSLAYVPAEDVMETIILDRAVSTESYDTSYTDTYYEESYDTSYEESYGGSSYDTSYEVSYDTTYDDSYSDGSYDTTYDDSYSSSYDTTYDDSYSSSSYDTAYDDSTSGSSDDSYTQETESSVSTSVSASDRELLAGIIYCEAGNQSRTGKVAVGAVVMNRVASSSFPDTISGVIYQSGQFTPAGSGWLDSVIANGAIPSSCYEAADAALAGENPVGSALYFNGGSGKGIQIGDHQFY